ncbi:MAG: hypothetical protein LBU84_01265 [Prevotella sp.]|jgi:exonuclease III|nr:hypothetical protein [Prevotella sp.]
MNGLSRYTLFALLWGLLLPVAAQENFRVVFYNVENMYDTKDNPDTYDDDLTPDGKLHWTNYRYWQKLNNISKVISSVGEGYPPALVGLCEVENDSVLFDLTKKAALQRHKYEYVITTSKDWRGSNVALLYQRDQIKILSKESYRPLLGDSIRTTRDILHVTGRLVNGEILDLFVCHFPSRNEGIKKTRPHRIKCAELLKQKCDSVSLIRKKANIIIMGDFNDYPHDISMAEILRAQHIESDISSHNLYNMFYHKTKEKNAGSYKYRGKWNFLDQFVVSGDLLVKSGKVFIENKSAYVYSSDFLLENDNEKYGGQKPFRTYSGFRYLGGYSDHLPIYMDLHIGY